MIREAHKKAMREGRDAAIDAVVSRSKRPRNPHGRGTKAHFYFEWGSEMALRKLDGLMIEADLKRHARSVKARSPILPQAQRGKVT